MCIRDRLWDFKRKDIMNIKEAQAITHTLSKPGKMPGFAYSTPAHECKTGTKLRAVAGSVCANCYAYERGRYRFQNVKDAQYKRFAALKHPLWATAMALQINSKKVKYFRWHDSGDVQNLDHLNKTYQTHPTCLLYTSPSPRDRTRSRMPSSA